MSVVVAYTNENGCWVSYDSAVTDGDVIFESTTPKAIIHAGNGIIGAAGSWRVINLISSLKKKRCTPENVVAMLKSVKGEDESVRDMEILCAWPNRPLVIIQSDFSVVEIRSSFMAIGAGAPYALGYLESFEEDEFSYSTLDDAVRVASKYSTAVIDPVQNLHCGLK